MLVTGVQTCALPILTLFPDPPSKPGPKKGGFALLRPEVVSRPWEPVKIVGEKDDRFTVADADGEERTTENRDLLPLRR